MWIGLTHWNSLKLINKSTVKSNKLFYESYKILECLSHELSFIFPDQPVLSRKIETFIETMCIDR